MTIAFWFIQKGTTRCELSHFYSLCICPTSQASHFLLQFFIFLFKTPYSALGVLQILPLLLIIMIKIRKTLPKHQRHYRIIGIRCRVNPARMLIQNPVNTDCPEIIQLQHRITLDEWGTRCSSADINHSLSPDDPMDGKHPCAYLP